MFNLQSGRRVCMQVYTYKNTDMLLSLSATLVSCYSAVSDDAC